MTLLVRDANNVTQELATGGGDGTTVPFVSPTAAAIGNQGDSPAASDTGGASLMAFIKRGMQNWTTLLGKLPGGGSPVVSPATALSVAAGGSATLLSQAVSSGKTGSLLSVIVTASVPLKAVLRGVSGGVAGAVVGTAILWEGLWTWTTPAADFVKEAWTGAGFDGFEVVLTNLDPSLPADLYATFYHSEA